jgi:hypothetical protein
MNKLNDSDKNVIDMIEERLKQLEKEKEEMEKLYNLDENLLKEVTSSNNINITNNKSSLKKKTISHPQPNYENLTKLDVSFKKELKKFYKTPNTLQDSLKFEPDIKDLLLKDEFEPTFTNNKNIKLGPTIPKGFNISLYIDYINSDYMKNYMN